MMHTISGIHHVTAIAIDPQSNIDFYTQVLGLRLVKETVNFDAPDTYHFYYGDRDGRPGTILTFFPFVYADRGRTGQGMADTITFSVLSQSLEHWMLRLTEHKVEFEGPSKRFSQQVIAFRDPDGLKLEIVGVESVIERDSSLSDNKTAIRGFDAVTLCVEAPERTVKLLTETFGYRHVGEEAGRQRFQAADAKTGDVGTTIDILCHAEIMPGELGGGTVHHVAFRARDDGEQKAWRELIVAQGFNVTPVLDRQYFHSIYFREPGGVLFEIATDPPGFAVDEAPERLGTTLKLPPWLERSRASIERRLPPVRLPGIQK